MENINLICGKSSNGKSITLDGVKLESFAVSTIEKDMVELHFASGIVIEVLNKLDEKLYPGENVVTLVDDCICRYFKDK